MELDPRDIDGIINDVRARNSNEEGNPNSDTGLLAYGLEETRGRTKTNRYLGYGALGAAVLAGVIGGGAYLGQSGNSEKITSLDDRVTGIEQRIGPNVLDIRSYLIDGEEQGCIDLGGQVAESGNDRQYGWSDCRFTPKQFGNSPHAFAERVIKDEYSNDMLSLADEKDDLTRDPYSKAGLEALLNGGYAGIIAEEAPQRQTTPSHSHTPRTQTTSYTPTITQPLTQEVGSDRIEIPGTTWTINNDTVPTPYAQFAQNANSLDCGSRGYTVNRDNIEGLPSRYIIRANDGGGENQTFVVGCQQQPTVPGEGGNNPTNPDPEPNGRGADATADADNGINR